MSLKTIDFYDFGDFRIDCAERTLTRGGNFIPVTPKVFETLLALVKNAGRIVEKEELMQMIWQDRFVEESNLTFNIGMLRKALGDDTTKPTFIETVPRRGYRFIAQVRCTAAADNFGFETADSGFQNSNLKINSLNGRATKSNGTLNGDSSAEDLNVKTPPAKVSRFNSQRIVFYVVIAAILIGAAWFLLARKQSTFYERLGAVNNNSGLLSVEKISDTGDFVGMNISPDGKLLVYNSQENGKNTIWLRQLTSGVSVPLLTMDESIVSTSFSNNSEYVFYTHQRKGESLGLSRISTLGGVPTFIFRGMHGYSFSPDEKQIAFGRNDEEGTKLMVSDADGRNERQIFLIQKPRSMFAVNWSPDGKSIAYCISGGTAGFGIYEYHLESSEEKSLSDVQWKALKGLMWLPDKSGLLVSGQQKEGVDQIWRVSYPSGQAAPITDDSSDLNIRSASNDFTRILASQKTLTSNVWVATKDDLSNARAVGKAGFDVAWTQDGKILFLSRDSAKTDIWLTNAEGAEKRQLTAGDPLERSPETSPDGRYIIYVSTRNGQENIWRMDADGANQIALTSGEGEIFPVFTPDGKSVVYASIKDKSLWRVSIEGGAPQQLSTTSHRRVGISPDGTKLSHIARINGKPYLVIESFPECAPLRQFDLGIISEAAFFRTVWTKDSKSVMYYINDAAFVGNLWRQPLEGGEPQKLTNFTSERIFDFAVAPDESRIAFVRGDWNFDAVLLKGLK